MGLDERPDALLEEQRVALGAFDQEPLQRAEAGVGAKKRIEQLIGAFGRQGIDPDLLVVRLAAPGVLVFGAKVDEEQEAR
jgi:hypothetical protein